MDRFASHPLIYRPLLAVLLLAIVAPITPAYSRADEVSDALEGFDDDVGDALEGFEDEVGDALEGFEDEPADVLDGEVEGGPASSPPEIGAKRFFELTGSLSVGASVNYLEHAAFAGPGRETDYRGLQRLRTRLNLQLDVDLPHEWKARLAGFGFYDWAYFVNGRDDYTEDVLDMYEWEVDFQEVWVQGSPLGDLDVKIGRQIVNWGRSDTLRVLDVLNPLDNREPGLVDIEDLRRPVAMVKIDYYLGKWSLSGIAIPEIRFDLNPPFGSDFAPVTSSLGTVEAFVVPEEIPDESLANTEWAVALKGIFSGWDVSFHYARYWRDTPYLRPELQLIPDPPGPPTVSLDGTELQHSRLTLVGAGGNYIFGSWLVKTEIAWIDGINYTTTTPIDLAIIGGSGIVQVPTGNVQKSRLDFMAGIEYYGLSNTNIALEVANRHIFGFREDMKPAFGDREDLLETTLRVTRNFMNERLELTALGVAFGSKAQYGSVVRLEARYDLRDALELGGGIIFYQKGDRVPFDTIKDNDRIFLEVKYSF